MAATKLKSNGTASVARRKELRQHLYTLAEHTTTEGTLTALATKIGINKYNVSNWIKQGYVPPTNAAKILRLKGARVNDTLVVTLEQLTPILF